MPGTSKPLRPGLVIALVSLPIFIGALDLTVVSAVLPHIIYELEIPLQSGLDEAAWIVSGYLLAYSIAILLAGRLSDVFGRRSVYLGALAVFALGSILVAIADQEPTRLVLRVIYLLTGDRPDPAQVALRTLIASRMIQALGGGAMVPVGMALAGDLYPPGELARPLGLIAAVDTAGWVVGHLYGGILTRFFDWRLIFWLNLPVCLLAFIWFWRLKLPQPQRSQRRMDWLGALLAAAALTALNLGLGSNLEGSTSLDEAALPPYALPVVLLAIALMLTFIWHQARSPSPLIPLSLFRSRNFSAANLANLLTGFSLFIAIANVPLFINTLVARTLEQGAWESGWLLSALTVPMALAAIPAGWLTVKAGYRWPALAGLLLTIPGFAWMTGWQASTPYSQMLPHLLIAGIGFGLTLAPLATAAINAAPPQDRGTASSLVIFFRLLGMTISVSSIATYGVHRASVLSQSWLQNPADMNEVVRVGMQAAEQVISETFVIAALVATLACLPIWMLKSPLVKGKANV